LRRYFQSHLHDTLNILDEMDREAPPHA
jgi:hypothetical protein